MKVIQKQHRWVDALCSFRIPLKGMLQTQLKPTLPGWKWAKNQAEQWFRSSIYWWSWVRFGEGAAVTTTVETVFVEPDTVPCWRWEAGTA